MPVFSSDAAQAGYKYFALQYENIIPSVAGFSHEVLTDIFGNCSS